MKRILKSILSLGGLLNGSLNKNFDAKPGGFSIEGTAEEVIAALESSGREDSRSIALEIMMEPATPSTRIRVYENVDGKICIVGGSGCGDPNCTACSKLGFESRPSESEEDDLLAALAGIFTESRPGSVNWREMASKLSRSGKLESRVENFNRPGIVEMVGAQIYRALKAEAGLDGLKTAIIKELGRLEAERDSAQRLAEQTANDTRPYIEALLEAKADDDTMKERAREMSSAIYTIPGYVLRLGKVKELLGFVAGSQAERPKLPTKLHYDEVRSARFAEVIAFLDGRGDIALPSAFIQEVYTTQTPIAELAATYGLVSAEEPETVMPSEGDTVLGLSETPQAEAAKA